MPGPGKGRTGRSSFKDVWLNETDVNGDRLSLYVQKTSIYTFKCTWCQTGDLAVDNIGKMGVIQHAKSKKHRSVADHRNGRVANQMFLAPHREEEQVDAPEQAEADNNNEPEGRELPDGERRGGGIMNYFQQADKLVLPVPTEKMSLGNKATKATIQIALKSVESNWSYNSLDTFPEFLASIAPDSAILQKVKFKASKLSYMISHGLGPHFHDILLDDLRKAHSYTLGLDSATTKHLGLSKSLDFKVRFYSERMGMVVDMFLDCHHLGHETADIMTAKIISSLEKGGLGLDKLITLSRDNPTVMRALDRKIRERAEATGNPRVLDFPDYLHPTHTALREGMKELGSDLEKFLVNVHGFFKLSTARREDMLALREAFEENDQFFLRYVSSRWLSTGPVAARVVEHWKSLTEYFLTFIPAQTDSSSKDAMDTARYREIVAMLKPANNQKNLTMFNFLIYLCKMNEPFLKVFQSEKPKVHRLYIDCIALIEAYMNIICKRDDVPYDNGVKLSQINMSEAGLLLSPSECFFGPGAEKEMRKLSEEKKQQIRKEFANALIKTVKYLLSHFPLKNVFLMDLVYLDPNRRGDPDFVKKLVHAARYTRRFSDTELEDLAVQLQAVKTLGLPVYEEKSDQLDLFWLDICSRVETVIGEKPEDLMKFVKICCALPHSNSFLERGFSDLKRIITGRESLSLESTNAHKTLLDFIRLVGGAQNVMVTAEMMAAVKEAHMRMEQEKRKKLREEEVERAQSKREEQERERKRKFDEEKKSWEEKHRLKADAIQVLKERFDIQSTALRDSLKIAGEAKKESSRKAGIQAAMEAQKNMESTRELVEYAQGEMEKLMGKKPRMK